MTGNRLLERTKSLKAPIERRAVLRWQVFCGQRWCGEVVIFEAPASADLDAYDFLYDGVMPNGDTVGPFHRRGDAAMAIAARVHQ